MRKSILANWLLPVIFTFSLLMYFLYSSPRLSNAGDANIAELLLASEKIKSGYFFISPILAEILRFLNKIYLINWWSVFSVFMMFTGCLIFLWFINKRYASTSLIIRLFLSVLFALFIWELAFKYEINFTQTTSMIGMAGILLIVDLCFEAEVKKFEVVGKILLGTVFLLTAGAIRWKALVLMLPFAIMCLAYIVVFPVSATSIIAFFRDSCKKRKKMIFLLLIICFTVLLSYGIRKIYTVAFPNMGAQIVTNGLREDIVDYIDRYPNYEDNIEIYDELGIDDSWINMVINYTTSDSNFFNAESMQKMLELRGESKTTVTEFLEILKDHRVLWITVLMMVVTVVCLKGWKNTILPLTGCLIAFILCSLYMVHIGRFAWRVTNGYLLASVLSYFVMTAHCIKETKEHSLTSIQKVLLGLITIVTMTVSITNVNKETGELIKPKAQITDPSKAELLDYIDSQDDKVFLYWDTVRFVDAYNLWAAHKPDYLDNYFPMSSSFVYGCTDKLAEYGITDLYRDLMQMPNIRVQNDNWFLYRYLKHYYNPCVTATQVEDINGITYMRYSEPVIPTASEDVSAEIVFKETVLYVDDATVKEAFYVECDLLDGYEDYYINIKDYETEEIYSYGLNKNESVCTGHILRMRRTWDMENAEIALVGKNKNGEIVQLAVLDDMIN